MPDEFTFEVVSVPVLEPLGRLAAILENDRDVALGQRVDGPTLDFYEQFERDVAERLDRAVLFGDAA